MRPKELQEKLGIDANRIKLYKREEVFSPENTPSGNRGTNYTEADFEALKLLEVLTKSGLTCGDIKKLQDSDVSLAEVVKARMESIETEIKRKQNALLMLGTILSDKAEFATFDTDRYWEVIHQKEAAGEKFIDIEDMYGFRPVTFVRDIRCPHCGCVFEVDLEDYLYDESGDEHENGMGPDIVYSFNSEGQSECPDCGAAILIEGWIREYPIGAYDSEDVYVSEQEN